MIAPKVPNSALATGTWPLEPARDLRILCWKMATERVNQALLATIEENTQKELRPSPYPFKTDFEERQSLMQRTEIAFRLSQ